MNLEEHKKELEQTLLLYLVVEILIQLIQVKQNNGTVHHGQKLET